MRHHKDLLASIATAIVCCAAVVPSSSFLVSATGITDGTLDTTFGNNGKVTTNIGAQPSVDQALHLAIQSDGKFIIAGDTNIGGSLDFSAVRYNADGTLDTTFGTGGIVTADFANTGDNDFGKSVLIQSDGKILLVGHSEVNGSVDFAAVRFTSNGTLDNTFGNAGKATADIGNNSSDLVVSATLQADGKILIGGSSYVNNERDFAIARFTANGSLDNTFGTGGKVTTDLGVHDWGNSVAVQTDGKIVLAGYSEMSDHNELAVVRYNTNGSLDNTFGTSGKVTTVFDVISNAVSVAVQADGKIIVAGTSDDDFLATRYYSTPPAESAASSTSTSSTSTTAVLNQTPTQSAPALSTVIGLPLATRPLVGNSALSLGQPLTVSYGGFTPGELVQLVVASTPQVIGSGYANASGFVTLTGALPRNLGAGKHTLAMFAPVSKKGFRQPITVTKSELPVTGSTNGLHNVITAMYLIAIGAGLVLARRRRIKA